MSEQQLLRDQSIEPTAEIIAEGLDSAYDAYQKFTKGLVPYEVQVDWNYYKDGNAWLGKGLYKWTTSRGTAKEKTVFWLSIWEGLFKVTFFLPEKYREDALNLPLNKEAKKMVKEAKQMGKLKFSPLIFDMDSDKLLDDIFTLVEFRKAI